MQNQYTAAVAEFVAMEKVVAQKGVAHRTIVAMLRRIKIDAMCGTVSSTPEATAQLQEQVTAAYESWMESVRECARASYYISALHGLFLVETGVKKEDYLVEAFADIKEYLLNVTTNLRTLDSLMEVEHDSIGMQVIDLGNIFMPEMKESIKDLLAA